MPLSIPGMIREMHLLRDVLEKDVVGSAATELQTIFGTAEVELAKQEKLFQTLLTDKNGLIENIPANLEAAGAHYRNVVKPQINEWITGPGKAWVEKTVPTMHTAGRRLAAVNLDVQDLSPELVKAAFDNVLVGEKAVLRVGFTDGYRIMNVVGDDVGEWFRQTTNDAVIEGIPVSHYDPNVDSLQSRLMHSGRIKPLTIKSKTGKTIHRSIRQRAQAIARIESTRIMNRTHEVLADEVLGDEAVFRNSNPQDSRSTFICVHASSQKAMTLLEWDNTPYGRPPRLNPFHLCRSVLIGGRPEWFDDVPEAQLQGAGLAKTTTKAVKTLTAVQKAAQTTAQLAQVALGEAAAAAAKKIATTSQATKAVAIGKQIDDILVGPSPQIHQKKLNSLLTEYQAVAPAAEWASKKKLQVGAIKAAKVVETESNIAGKLAQAADLDLSDALKNKTFTFESPPIAAGNMKPLIKEWGDVVGDVLEDANAAKIAAWKKQYQDAWETAIIKRQKPLKDKWTAAESLDLEPQLAAKKKILKDMEDSSLFAGGQMSSFQDNVGHLLDGIKHSQMVEMQNEFLTLHGAKDFDGAKAHLAKMKTADAFEDFQIVKAQEMLDELSIEPKIVEYDDLLAQVASGKLGPKKTVTVKKKIKKLGDEIHLLKEPGTVGHFPSDIAKSIQAAEAELAAKFSPEVVAFHNEYAKLITTKKVPIADAADILTKHKAGTLHGKASAKAKQAVEAVKDSLDPPAPIIPDAPEPPPPVGQIHADFADVDKAWDEIDANEHFTFQGEANVGGMHSKEFFVDPAGERWLFKPFPNISAKEATFRGMSDEFAYKLQRVIDVDAPEARFVQMGNRRGSIQRWREGGTGTLEDVKTAAAVADLTPAQLAHIQREHVLDWLLSNHDGHGGQFVTFSDGKLLGVDKGQAYRWFGEDKLDFDYHPNSMYGEREPLFNTMMKGLRDGKVDLDPKVTLEAIELFEGISDDVLEAIAKPYADARFTSMRNADKFITNVIARKNALRADFEDYYRRALKDDSFSFTAKAAPETVTSAIEGPTLKRFGMVGEEIAENFEDRGWQGRELPFDGTDVEDQSMLIFADKAKDGTTRTNAQLRLRDNVVAPELDKRIVKWFEDQGPTDIGGQAGISPSGMPSISVSNIGDPLIEDNFFIVIKKAVISNNKHNGPMGDGKPNIDTINAMDAIKPALEDLKIHADPDVKDMASAYLNTIEELHGAMAAKVPLKTFHADVKSGSLFSHYKRKDIHVPVPVAPTAAPAAPTGIIVEKGQPRTNVRQPDGNGHLQEITEDGQFADVNSQIDKTGTEYTARFPDGTVLRYRPWEKNGGIAGSQYDQLTPDKCPLVFRGDIELTVPHAPGPASLNRVLEVLEEVGIDASPPGADVTEVMYLGKVAYASLEHVNPLYINMIASIPADATLAHRATVMRKYWENKLNVPDLKLHPRYKPEGERSPGYREWKNNETLIEAGRRYWYRFDVDPADLKKDMKGYRLQTTMDLDRSTDPKIVDFLRKSLDDNGTMLSARERLRNGIKGGASVGSDVKTGGSSYAYARIMPVNNYATGLHWKLDRLTRVDAISYNGDKYGNVSGSFVTENRGPGIAQWKSHADGNSSNETLFKHELSLLGDVDHIVLNNRIGVESAVAEFHKRGITHFPDGRKVEDVVITKRKYTTIRNRD